MNKRAFTLIELTAIIIVLGIIAAITVPVIGDTISNSKKKAYETQISLIIEGANKWAIKNIDRLPEDDTETYVTIDELVAGRYLENINGGNIINPMDNTTMSGCVVIRFSSEYNQYEYVYSEICE